MGTYVQIYDILDEYAECLAGIFRPSQFSAEYIYTLLAYGHLNVNVLVTGMYLYKLDMYIII